MKLDRTMLVQMHRMALSEYKDKGKSPHETHEEFLARCWCEAIFGVLKGEGCYVAVVLDSFDGELPVGVESLGISKPGM